MLGNMILLAVYFTGCGAIFFTSFCRLAMTDHTTRLEVRVFLWLLSLFAASSVAVTLLYGYIPHRYHVFAVMVILTFQLSTTHRWREGVPRAYRPIEDPRQSLPSNLRID